ncbi:estradiol 17-beta-dehydrogenase 8-like [Rhipicephalus sanguineus]|uniref:estradiol 17-beta-dehydrogenase 8-like n=1 Tax=Rhipicephalus sanguineus TaxID=34632 RepID=UPI0020C1CF77|nr:estradiol 17-beta-dehydrogenase 8-like [Rhipicephalus sanguineus]
MWVTFFVQPATDSLVFTKYALLEIRQSIFPSTRLAYLKLRSTCFFFLQGTFLMSRTGIRRMLDAGVKEGAVVNVSSITAKAGMKGLASYVASKTGILGMTKSMAMDVAGTGIRCNAVLPGFTVTPMSDHLTEDEKKQLTATIPLSRPAQPREVAQVVAFLCGPQSSYMVGTMVEVSGGAVL